MHRATPRFWRSYEALPDDAQRLADKCFDLLKQDARHPSLQLKKVGRFRSVRIGLYYRALAVEESGDGAVMIVHADLPLLTARDIDTFVARSQGYELAIGPCKEDRGTNALLLRNPNVIPLSFGIRSFKKHLSHAKKTKLQYKVVRVLGLRFDIDEPRDLRVLMHRRVRSETQRFLGTLWDR